MAMENPLDTKNFSKLRCFKLTFLDAIVWEITTLPIVVLDYKMNLVMNCTVQTSQIRFNIYTRFKYGHIPCGLTYDLYIDTC